MEKQPIFILGCPRSGTTLLSSLLSSTTYGAPVETHFITKYFKKLGQYGDLSEPESARGLLCDILRERPVMQWKLNLDLDQFVSELPDQDYPAIVNRLCMTRFGAMGKRSWGDKTPHYILDLDIILDLFPASKYLYIVRDGRDVALSLLKKPWGPNNVWACADYWVRCNRASPALQRLRESGQLLEIRYESLLSNPGSHIRRVYEFIEEPRPNEEVADIAGSIQGANFGKWKKAMTPRQIELFESVASETLKRLGYSITYPQRELSPQVKYFWRMHDAFFHFKHLVKMNTIDTIRIKYFGMVPFAD